MNKIKTQAVVLVWAMLFCRVIFAASSFSDSDWYSLGLGMNGDVEALAVDGAGNVIAGGDFLTAGGVSAAFKAKWNGSSWNAMGPLVVHPAALTADRWGTVYAGGVDGQGLVRWNGQTWVGIPGVCFLTVRALASDNYGNVYIGGDGIDMCKFQAAPYVMKWNGSSLSKMGSGILDVHALVVDGAGRLYAGGSFSQAGGGVANGVALWNGSTWVPVGRGMNGTVKALAVDSANNVYAGGVFTTADGFTVNNIAKWNGTSWAPMGDGFLPYINGVLALAVNKSGLYAGGSFRSKDGKIKYIARWDGASWSALGSGVNSDVKVLATDKSGALYVGGSFTTAGGRTAARIARVYKATPPTPVVLSPSGGKTVGHRPSFSWTATEGATWYQLWINRNGQAYATKWVEGVNAWTPTNDLPGGNYRWWVQPWGPFMGNGEWSGYADFSIPLAIPGSLAQIAPAGAQSSYNLIYRWNKDANATWYRLWVGRVGASTWHDRWFNMVGTGEAAVNPGNTNPGSAKPIQIAPKGTIAGKLPTFQWSGGTCEWWLQGWGPDGYGPWAGPKAFSIPHAAGTWYRTYVNRGSTMVLDQWTNGANLPSPVTLTSGAHSWWLGVWDAAGNKTIWSDRMDFTVP